MRNAFSLVELSIVLVILGLLTGGILAGQSLIRAAELRSVTNEYQRYITASQSFRDKYMALPGDMANATRFWGDDNAACADAAIPNGSPGTCSGDGDGIIESALVTANVTAEIFRFWQQLALAGLIEGTYTGIAGPLDGWDATTTNVPKAKLGQAVWYIYPTNRATTTGDGSIANGTRNGWIQFGSDSAINTDNPGAVMKPEEAWNIDTKIDDGRPGIGRVEMRGWNGCTDAASAAAATNSNYNLTNNSVICALMFVNPFN